MYSSETNPDPSRAIRTVTRAILPSELHPRGIDGEERRRAHVARIGQASDLDRVRAGPQRLGWDRPRLLAPWRRRVHEVLRLRVVLEGRRPAEELDSVHRHRDRRARLVLGVETSHDEACRPA